MDPYKQPYINPNVPPSVPGNATNFTSSPGFYGHKVSPSFTQTGDYSSTYPRFAIPVYGASYSPAFGTPSSYFGGPSFSGQKSGGFWQPQPEPSTNRCGSTAPFSATSIPATGRTSTPTFGITNTQSSGFRQPQPALSTNLPQPVLSTNLYGSTAPFAATGTPATGPTSTQTFGVTNTHSFGSTNTPAFDATSTSAFRSTTAPTFGGTGTTFGVSSIPVSSSSTVPASGSSCTAPYVPFYPPKPIPAFVGPFAPFSSFLYPVYSNQSIPAFGSMQVGTNASPSGDGIYPFESSASGQKPAFGVSGSSPSQISPCGFQQAQSAFHGANTTNSSLGLSDDQSAFDDQSCGTSATLYTSTAESDSQYPGELESDHTLPENKCQEELRWEHCQLRNEGSEGTKTRCVQEVQANIIKSQDDLVVALKEKIADLEDELHDLRNCPPMISNSCNEQHLEKEVWESKLKLDAMTRERNLLSEMLAFFQQIVTVMSSRTTMMSSVGLVPSEGCCNSILTSLLEKKAPAHLSSAKQGCDKVKLEDYDLQAGLVESVELLALVEQERDDAVKEACDLRCQLLKLSQGAKGIKCSNEKTNRGGGYLNKEEMNISTDEQGPVDLNWKTCKGNSNNNFKEITHKGVYSHGHARCGQATDDLFLAEKVRRYEISRRMKYLQDLVPGCNKISDKVKMLDEVINYVQSLQSQPESLHSNTTFSTQLHQPPSLPLPPSVPGADHVGVGVGSTNYLNLGL